MKSLQLDEAKAKEIYPGAPDSIKTILEETFGKKAFSKNIMDRIKTFEDACDVLGFDPGILKLEGSGSKVFHKKDVNSISAYLKLIVIVRALNEGWEPNWDNSNESKYYPYFDMRMGFGFSGAYYDYWSTFTTVGSRLCFKSRELAEYAVKQFESIYKDFLTL